METAFRKIEAGLNDALAFARGDESRARVTTVVVTTTCVHCQFGLQPVRLRRRWVHHFADTGQIVVCEDKGVKPAS